MSIYLDIDGTLIHENFAEPKAAAGLEELLIALRSHQAYWLTTHCRDGNPERARDILKRFVSPELHADIDRIRPTVWDVMKTEGIDWSKDFVWLDNDISPYEWEQLEQGSEHQYAIEINLRANPNQLLEVVEELKSLPSA